MNSASDTQYLLDQQLKACGRQIAGTLTMGALAACLAIFGQDCLAQARPIFPFIDQLYGDWQGLYVAALLIFGMVWAIALVRQLNGFQACLHSVRAQQRLAEQREQRERRKQEARGEREREREAAAMAARAPLLRNARSSKFDY